MCVRDTEAIISKALQIGIHTQPKNPPLGQFNTTLREICGTHGKGVYVWTTTPCHPSTYWSVFHAFEVRACTAPSISTTVEVKTC